jgi:hypothetical protein
VEVYWSFASTVLVSAASVVVKAPSKSAINPARRTAPPRLVAIVSTSTASASPKAPGSGASMFSTPHTRPSTTIATLNSERGSVCGSRTM